MNFPLKFKYEHFLSMKWAPASTIMLKPFLYIGKG